MPEVRPHVLARIPLSASVDFEPGVFVFSSEWLIHGDLMENRDNVRGYFVTFVFVQFKRFSFPLQGMLSLNKCFVVEFIEKLQAAPSAAVKPHFPLC